MSYSISYLLLKIKFSRPPFSVIMKFIAPVKQWLRFKLMSLSLCSFPIPSIYVIPSFHSIISIIHLGLLHSHSCQSCFESLTVSFFSLFSTCPLSFCHCSFLVSVFTSYCFLFYFLLSSSSLYLPYNSFLFNYSSCLSDLLCFSILVNMMYGKSVLLATFLLVLPALLFLQLFHPVFRVVLLLVVLFYQFCYSFVFLCHWNSSFHFFRHCSIFPMFFSSGRSSIDTALLSCNHYLNCHFSSHFSHFYRFSLLVTFPILPFFYPCHFVLLITLFLLLLYLTIFSF